MTDVEFLEGQVFERSCLQPPLTLAQNGNQEIVIPKINHDSSRFSQDLDLHIPALIFTAYYHDVSQNRNFQI